MADLEELKQRIKEAMVEELMMQDLKAEDIADDAAIFSPTGLGLDSVDALQLVVTIEKRFGLKMPNAEAARVHLHSVNTIAEAILAKAP